MRIIAGAMSGTSADGVDIALVEIDGQGLAMKPRLLRHHHRAYPAELRKRIFAIRENASCQLAELASVGREISLTYATAVNESLNAANISASKLSAVAAHGQTLYHAPPDTIQWLDPALIAAEVGCPVVSDFRRADCAAGGQGAPLVPFADYILYRHSEKNRALLNIGGIANITFIPANGTLDQIVAFDTGPGNCISDYLCRKHDPDGLGYDVDGERASRGKYFFKTAHVAGESKYAFRPPPKSTDGPEMNHLFETLQRDLEFEGSFEDALATACAVSAFMVSTAIHLGCRDYWNRPVDEILVSGGGVQNQCLMQLLRDSVGKRASIIPLDSSASQSKEALAFALLGCATLDGIPSNVPSATGAKKSVVLGSVTPKP